MTGPTTTVILIDEGRKSGMKRKGVGEGKGVGQGVGGTDGGMAEEFMKIFPLEIFSSLVLSIKFQEFFYVRI